MSFLSGQGTPREIEPFLHGIELLTEVPKCRIGRGDDGRAGFQPLSKCARKATDDRADGDDSDNQDHREGIVHRIGSGFNYWSYCSGHNTPFPLERSPPASFKRSLGRTFPHGAGRRVDCQAINSQPRAPRRYTARYRMPNARTWPPASTRIAERPVTTALE